MGSQRSVTVDNLLLKIHFDIFGSVTAGLPLYALITCFVTGMAFQFEDVNETMCNVKNLIPSVSGITGVEPQRYLWRICVALQATPRFIVGVLYYNTYMLWIHNVSEKWRTLYKRLATATFWIYFTECSCLLAVSAVSNKENYPVHEKIFVVFMVCILFYMLFTIILFQWAHPDLNNVQVQKSLWRKKLYFFLCLSFTAGLLFFFVRHRIYCIPGAFSWFSACEYGITAANIGFHYTGAIDFKGRSWFVGIENEQSIEQTKNHKKN